VTTTLSPQEFVNRWRGATLKEKSAAQSHFNDVCHLVGHATPTEYDTHGTTFVFEARARPAPATAVRAAVGLSSGCGDAESAAVASAVTVVVGTPSLATDQRGRPRSVDGNCDIGAVERQPADSDLAPSLYLPLSVR
jgi:hypothetical protein